MNIKWNGTFWIDDDDKTEAKQVANIPEEEIKCDVNPTFNCTTCEHKKDCMPKEDLER
jgi:hypothetical protein